MEGLDRGGVEHLARPLSFLVLTREDSRACLANALAPRVDSQVVAGERMATLADSLLAIVARTPIISATHPHVACIVLSRPCIKVIRTNAQGRIAMMEDIQIARIA
jgi:hypothetical protein